MKKILFVDDEADLLKVSSIRLRKVGYEVCEARDGREVLALARREMPDLVVLDVFLPVLDGDEVAKLWKKDEKLKHIPVILISADAENLERKARESGADGYLAKAFDFEDLMTLVKKHIG